MKKLIITLVIVLTIIGTAYASTCFYKGERLNGLYRTCYYDCAGGTVAISVKAYEMCPLSIQQ